AAVRASLHDAAVWPGLLRAAFEEKNNLVAWQVYQPFLEWVQAQPQVAAAALRRLWTEPVPTSIDAFLDGVPESTARGSGARLSLASFLLSGADAGSESAAGAKRFPTWRAVTVDKAFRL